MQEESLLDRLAAGCGCNYLSELYRVTLHSKLCQQAAHSLSQLPAQEFSIEEWTDAARYLSGGALSEKQSAEEIKTQLLQYLELKK